MNNSKEWGHHTILNCDESNSSVYIIITSIVIIIIIIIIIIITYFGKTTVIVWSLQFRFVISSETDSFVRMNVQL